MASVYILYSVELDRYYTGSCKFLEKRLEEHNNKTYLDSYTAKASDWVLFLSINNLGYSQARGIEEHIKRMKSKKYIENLKRYPEIIDKSN